MEAMKRTRSQPPYHEDGRTTFPARNVPGCYLIYRLDGWGGKELRYVGYSRTDVYKALYRHFQTWNDRQADRGERSERITYRVRSNVRVRVIYCNSGAQAGELERALILKYKPKDNPDKLELYELTEAGVTMASEAMAAPYVTDMEAPF